MMSFDESSKDVEKSKGGGEDEISTITPNWNKFENGPLHSVYTAAFYKKKLNKRMVLQCPLKKSCLDIRRQAFQNNISLRWIGMLLHGICIIYSKQMEYLVHDSDEFNQRLALASEKQTRKKRMKKDDDKILSLENQLMWNADEHNLLSILPLQTNHKNPRFRVSEGSLHLQDEEERCADDMASQIDELPDLAADLNAMGRLLGTEDNVYPKYTANEIVSEISSSDIERFPLQLEDTLMDAFEQPVASIVNEDAALNSPFKSLNAAYQGLDTSSVGKRDSDYQSNESSPFNLPPDVPPLNEDPLTATELNENSFDKFNEADISVGRKKLNEFSEEFPTTTSEPKSNTEKSRTNKRKTSNMKDGSMILTDRTMKEWVDTVSSTVLSVTDNPIYDTSVNFEMKGVSSHQMSCSISRLQCIGENEVKSKRHMEIEMLLNSTDAFKSFTSFGVNLSSTTANNEMMDSLTEHLRHSQHMDAMLALPTTDGMMDTIDDDVCETLDESNGRRSDMTLDIFKSITTNEEEEMTVVTPMRKRHKPSNNEEFTTNLLTPIKSTSPRRRSIKRRDQQFTPKSDEYNTKFTMNERHMNASVKLLLQLLRDEWTMININKSNDEHHIFLKFDGFLKNKSPLSISRMLCDLLVLESKGLIETMQQFGEGITIRLLEESWNVSLDNEQDSTLGTPLLLGRFKTLEASLPAETPFHQRLLAV